MARRTLEEALQRSASEVAAAQVKLDKAGEVLSTAMNQQKLLQEFSQLQAGDYINTVAGKGTVLNVMEGKDRAVRVFTGAGETANITTVYYWSFKGLAKKG